MMGKTLAVLAFSAFVVSSVTAQEEQEEQRRPRFDVSILGGSYDLDEVEFDPENTFLTDSVDLEVERDRVGGRFTIGSEAVRGFVQFMTEEWSSDDSAFFDEFDLYGLGGGVRGTPHVGKRTSELGLVIPYQAGLTGWYGSEEFVDEDVALIYLEFLGEVGFGVEWRGLRPTVGLVASALGGTITASEDFDGDGDDDRIDITGLNVGGYAELAYKHPEFPLYGRVRVGGGDYDTAEFVIGANW